MILIKRKESSLQLNFSDDGKISFAHKKLFTALFNFGYIPTAEGAFKISDRNIVNFWKHAKSSVLKETELKEYYMLLNLAPLYESQIPTLKESENYNSPSNKLSVVWINDTSTGKMASAPKAYKREGLELFNFDDEKIGSLYPEYFDLYELVDEINLHWEHWTKTERYAALEKIAALSEQRKIVLSKPLEQTLEYIKSN